MTDPVITARNLSLTFQTADGPVDALKDIDLTINAGDFVSFIGPSGCGNTTFLRCIAGLENPTGGSLSVNGMTPDQARRARAYGYVFQAPGLYPWRTIAGNIGLPLEIMGFAAPERQAPEGANLIPNSLRVKQRRGRRASELPRNYFSKAFAGRQLWKGIAVPPSRAPAAS